MEAATANELILVPAAGDAGQAASSAAAVACRTLDSSLTSRPVDPHTHS
jgi:hypothetical protein